MNESHPSGLSGGTAGFICSKEGSTSPQCASAQQISKQVSQEELANQGCPQTSNWSLWNTVIGTLDAGRHEAAAISNGALDAFDYIHNWVDQIEWEHSLAETLYAIEENSQNPAEDQGAADVILVIVLIAVG